MLEVLHSAAQSTLTIAVQTVNQVLVWDRAPAPAVGGGLPDSLFRYARRDLISTMATFPEAPHNHGRPDFPDPVGNLGLSSVRLSIGGEVQALVRIRPVFRGLHTASFHHMRRLIASALSGPALPMQPPSVQSPFTPCRCYRHLGETCTAS